MISRDEGALICDMAEYYHVLDYKGLPLQTAAALAAGLPEDSRSIRAMTGSRLTLSERLQAMTADLLRLLVWMRTEDGHKGRNRPASILQILSEGPQEPECQGYESGEDFREAWESLAREYGGRK